MTDIREIHRHLKGKNVITHTGHRDIPESSHQVVHQKLVEKLNDIIHDSDKPPCVIAGIEKGADELMIAAAVQLHIPLYIICITENDIKNADDSRKKYAAENILIFKIEDKPDEPADETYKQLANLLIKLTNVMIVLWDGVFNGKKGGTSDIVDCLVNSERKKKIVLNQLVVPREENNFPIGRYFYTDQNLPSVGKYEWVETTLEESSTKRLKKFTLYFNKRLRSSGEVFGRFLIPLALIVLVFCFGMPGYYECPADDNPISFLNAFFHSANLITFNTSVFKFKDDIPWQLNVARIIGGCVTVYAFGLGFYFALGYENRKRLLFFFHRRFGKCNYNVIIGLNDMAFATAFNSIQKVKTIVLYNNDNATLIERCKNEGIWLIKGNPYAAASLRKTYFEKANKVYVITANEEDNFRCIQEMDELVESKKVNANQSKWFVQITDVTRRNMLQEFVRTSNRSALTSFSIAENTARRLLIKYPINRYTNPSKQNKINIIIAGFTPVAEHVLLTALEQSVLFKERLIKIHLYYNEEEKHAVIKFMSRHKWLSSSSSNEAYNNVTSWVLLNQSDIIVLHPLTYEDIAEEINVEDLIKPDNITSIYVCKQSGIENASLLGLLLPKLSFHRIKNKDCDVAVFWFYNFPDKDEEAYLQKKINTLARNMPVISFGNHLTETTSSAIANKTMDFLAKQVALWYYLLYNYHAQNDDRNSVTVDKIITALLSEKFEDAKDADKITGMKHLWFSATQHENKRITITDAMHECWKTLSETDREGNRQAADHMWIKLNEAGVHWQPCNKQMSFDELINFWPGDLKEQLAVLEQRRWNMMKLLEGFKPYDDKNGYWKKHKELIKKQLLHQLLIPHEELKHKFREQAEKDVNLVEGIPFFLALYFRHKLKKSVFIKLKTST